MNIKNIVLASLMITAVVLSSCRKEEDPLRLGGCNDENSPVNEIGSIDYDDASCLFGYITEYQVTYHPQYDNVSGSGDDWDWLTETDADLILKIKQDTASGWFFESFEHSNQAHTDTARWGAPYEYQILNTSYSWELWDVDGTSADDLVSSGQFNAIEQASNGAVTTTGYNAAGDSAELRILYDLRRGY